MEKVKMFWVLMPILGDTLGHYTVSTDSGNIQGRFVYRDRKWFQVFKGIPYAEPPTGNLRFSNPKPIADWPMKIDASGDFKAKCPQAVNEDNNHTDPTPVDEDCLFLNIFAPFGRAGPYPVMVRIHGGGFFVGAGSNFKEDGILKGLVSKDTIVVTLNYRLGPFGFFNLRNNETRGNFGFLDQIEALKWIRNNIQFFGGDPEKITISGASAGAISVSLLTLSPLADGLFSQAIIQSGSALALWSVTKDNDPHDSSKLLLEQLSCNLMTNQEKMECIRGKPIKEIVMASIKVLGTDNIYVDWNARIDGYFLPDSIVNLTLKRSRKLKVLMGVTKDEYGLFEFIGGLRAQNYVDDSEGKTIQPVINSSLLEKSIHNFMPAEYFPNPEAARFAAKCKYITSVKCKAAKKSELEQREFWLRQSISFKSSLMFWVPTYEEAVLLQSTEATVYFYEFDYLSENALAPPGKELYGIDWKGVMHAVENFYIFGSNLDLQAIHLDNKKFLEPRPMTPNDAKFADFIQTLWTNFVRFGDPTPDHSPFESPKPPRWKRFKPSQSNYYSISLNPHMKTCFRTNEMDFWHNSFTLEAGNMSLVINATQQKIAKERCFNDLCCVAKFVAAVEFCNNSTNGLKPNIFDVFESCCQRKCPDDLLILNFVCNKSEQFSKKKCSSQLDPRWITECGKQPCEAQLKFKENY